MPGVLEVAPGLVEVIAYSTESTDLSLLLQGWVPGSFLYDDLEIEAGRLLRSDDRRKVILGETLARNIDRGVGDSITLQREEFEVVGVYRSLSVFENGAVTMPLAELQDIMVREASVTGFNVVTAAEQGGADIDEVCQRINELENDQGRSLGLPPCQPRNMSASQPISASPMAWRGSRR